MNNNKEMSLVKSFSIMFFILFVIGASTFAYLISHLLQQDMLEHSIHNVKNMVHSSFSNHYTSADFLAPKSGDEYERMKESMSHLSLDPNISKLKIWNTDMVLIWSDNKKYIGKKFEDNEDLKKVLKDITVHSGSHKTQQMYEQHNAGDDSEHNHADHAVEEQKQDMENILEYYIPIKFRDADSANIVVEVYHNYNNVIISGKRHAQQIWFWTFLFSVVAYVYLLALVRKASSRINKQTHALSETIETLTGEIDKREMIESKLKKASEDWRGTFNSAHDVIFMLDNEFYLVKMNRSGASLCNKKLTEVVGEYVDALFVDAELPEIGSYLLTAKRTKMREEIELSSDKSLLWYSISIDPILDDNRVSGFVLIIRDITDLKLMQTSLISSKKDWENTFDTITDIITIHDNDYNIINANKAGKEALSITDPSFLVKPKCFTMYHGVDAPPTGCPSCNCYNTKKSAIFEIYEPYLKKFVEIRSIPRLDDNGDLLGLIHVVRDISERKKDETLIETQIAHLNALSSIDKAIIGSMDINITLDIYLDQVIKQLEVDAATILILNPKTHVLLYINSKGLRTNALKNTRMKLGK
ncbi:MAG: PAS domain-containing protein, partial [Candidatus Brocadiales bacterium]|nr:PAS domain-containing protein [Candidatus Brocadiales bacterium]